MKVQKMFCSGCDRDVRVVLTAEPAWEGHATVQEPEFVCLEIGATCTGALCPLCAQSPAVMASKLARHELETGGLPRLRATCDGCGLEGELVVIGHTYVHCPDCGTTSRWSVIPEDHLRLPVS